MGSTVRNGGRVAIRHSGNEFLNKVLDSHKKRSIASVNILTPGTSYTNNLTDSWQKINFFEREEIIKGPLFSVNTVDQSVTISESCEVKVYGNIISDFDNTKEYLVTLSINGVALEPGFFGVGRGAGKPTPVVASNVFGVNAGDILTLEAKSVDPTGTLTVKSCSVTIEFIDIV